MFYSGSKSFKLLILGVFIFTFFLPFGAEASFSVSPPVLDRSGVPRDSVTETITLTSNVDNRNMRIFTFVNNVSVEEESGREDFTFLTGLDTAESLANWVSITRQEIVLSPGESKDIPITVKIDRDAEPGKYHAFISFSEGSRRSEAEGEISRDRATLLVIDVEDDSEDILNLKSFITKNRIVSGSPVEFLITLDNRGDTTLTPKGELSVYDKRGGEIEVVRFNEEEVSIDPEEERTFAVLWEGDLDWGKHRARLTLDYGSNGRRYSMDDTIFFTNIPIVSLVVSFFVLLFLVIFSVHLLHKRHERSFQTQNKRRRNSFGHDEPDEHTINLRRW